MLRFVDESVVMAANQNMLNNSHTHNQSDELNFTAFTDLCRFCSLRIGPKIHLFEKEAEQRQILYKIRSFLPIAVNTNCRQSLRTVSPHH